jgi:aminoglycoside phosphotransferase (APT) family kinase protein
MDLTDLQQRLERWASAHYEGTVAVEGLSPMPGHAGLSFGFRVVREGDVVDDLVTRMPPKGVRRRGNTDVLRQVPLLQALLRCGRPVAPVRWWSDDESWFEVPFFMVDRLPGTTFTPRGSGASDAEVATVFGQAIDALASIHTLDAATELAGWEEPRALLDEVRYWDPILAKAAESEWIGMGESTRDLLLERLPADPDVGLFHGDFQTGNILFDDGRLVAVVDWEISGIGAHLLDVGWLFMMNDPESWADGDPGVTLPSFEDLVERYSTGVGRPVTLSDVAFYRALSGYRFGVISCLNVMLHRTGKRPDALWEGIAPSVPLLFGRAADLLRGAS